MDISNAEYQIVYKDQYFWLEVDQKVLKTPAGNEIKHSNIKVLENLQYELECIDELDPSTLSMYSLLSTQLDFLEKPNFSIDKKVFRELLLNDPTLKACAGPEKVFQFSKWSGLFEHLELIDMDYPDIIQAIEMEDVEEWILSMGTDYVESIEKFVDHFYREFEILSIPQKTAIINSIKVYDSVIYGLLLATRKCSEMEYSVAILASHCIIPKVFSDVERSEYREDFINLKQDALLLTEYIDLSLTPDFRLAELIKMNVPNWGLLPESSRYSLSEAIRNIHLAKSDDYSSNVMLLGKSLEVVLKQLVFDQFQKRSGIEIQEQKEVSQFIKENQEVSQLAKFIVKEPHFIELGSMLITLEMYGGRTAKKNGLLKSFFEYVTNELNFDLIIKRSWIESAKVLSRARNKAAHSDRFTLDEAKSIQKITFELLEAF